MDKETINLQDAFREVYHKNVWGSSESKSGPGSEHDSVLVRGTIKTICDVIRQYLTDKTEITLSDIPCGDFNWIHLLFIAILDTTHVTKITYFSYDIVPDIKNDWLTLDDRIKQHNLNVVLIPFQQLDLRNHSPSPTDIVLCKELFIHLSLDDIQKCLVSIQRSGSMLCVFSDHDGFDNTELEYSSLGICREVCLVKPPFCLQPVLYHEPESGTKAFFCKNIFSCL